LYRDGEAVGSLQEGEEGVIVLEQTPFYAESGGQIGDSGVIETASSKFEVLDCVKSGSNHLHLGKLVSGEIKEADKVEARVEPQVRIATARNHSATHLLHAALRKVLGDHVTQKGSLNDSERLRFDFSHFEAVSASELEAISDLVNEQIRSNTPVETELCDMDTAKTKGAMALFGEKYGDEVRVLSMGDDRFSVELCGGTHVERTGDIGFFYLVSESGIASGVRRIEAVTGLQSLQEIKKLQQTRSMVATKLKASPDKLEEKLDALVNHSKNLEKEMAQLKAKLASASADEWLGEAVEVAGLKLLVKTVEGADNRSLRDSVDKLKDKLGTAAVLLAGVNDGKIALVAGVTKDATQTVKAGDLVKHVAAQVGGKGGGRPDMAQGGGTDLSSLPQAMNSVLDWVQSQ
jgi:alanyl-tRNA synthetase